MLRTMFAMAAVALAAGPVAAAEAKYTLTGDNTKIEFVGTKKNGKHNGGFKKVTGTATAGDKETKIEVVIDTDSLYSDDPGLTKHLKAGDFFNVKDHPTAKFKSTKVEKKDSIYVITGDLTLLGKTKEISFPVEMQTGDTLVIKGEFKINRADWGMTFGKGMIDEVVQIKVKVEAKK